MRHNERSRTVPSLRTYLASVSAQAKASALRQVRLDSDTNTLDFHGSVSRARLTTSAKATVVRRSFTRRRKPALYDRALRRADALQMVEHPLPMHALPVVQNPPTGSP